MAIFESISAWHYLVLALALLGFEALGVGGFLLGAAVASFGMTVVMFIFPEMHWHIHMSLFALSSVVISILYWKYFKTLNNETDAPFVNDRMQHYLGRRFELEEPIKNGLGRVQIGDTFWKVTSPEDIDSGKTVEVVDVDGLTLVVKST